MIAAYEFEVQMLTTYGWECVTTEATKSDAWDRLMEYQANAPESLHRVKRVQA
jgi:hypothetical protein